MSEEINDDVLTERVAKVIDAVRPMLQSHGGDCELIKVEDRIVYVELQGACHGCPMALQTLKNGIEEQIKAEVPEIIRVERI